ncbi:hypothetical protein [Streptomyces poonensis]|uniref:Uncharacterized protein n=1 Tax=Streptomyces poonensis TaxID=68255 RepID=A0A918PB61_9ACTN|nr:hypothetical protein [Streptomyces poonensis]GGY95688.1 hypothetical protein GCM10010365_13210 [Streptomyces poonensis]GLJ88852.1 hypothetical protein GCM10017589_14520 [Streptomyces poonensis]
MATAGVDSGVSTSAGAGVSVGFTAAVGAGVLAQVDGLTSEVLGSADAVVQAGVHVSL